VPGGTARYRPAMRQGAGESILESLVVEDCDRVVFATRDVVLGEFRCATTYPGFATAGRITHHVVAFPRTAVWIERASSPRFVADPSLATIYSPRADYVRAPISPEGDLSDWLGVSECLARDIVREFDRAAADSDAPFRPHRADVSPALYRAQRELFNRARVTQDALETEETVIGLVNTVLRSACASSIPSRAKRRREVIENAKAIIMARLGDNLGVCDIAAELGISSTHLCHSFRSGTGSTLHAYRRDVRLRVALGLAPSYRGNLSALALQTGFYSHSHFTAAFRRAFGDPPGATLH
jgi:AraC-like DNA-binding protein